MHTSNFRRRRYAHEKGAGRIVWSRQTRMMSAPMASVFRSQQLQREKSQASSVAPVEIDVDVEIDVELPPPGPCTSRTDSTVLIERMVLARPRRKLGWIIGGAVAVALTIGSAAIVRNRAAPDAESRRLLAAIIAPSIATTPTTLATPKPALTVAAPAAVGASDLRAAPVGTVIGPAGRVYLDGTKLKGTSAIVPCGTHAIRVAPSSKVQKIDVPCGGEVRVR